MFADKGQSPKPVEAEGAAAQSVPGKKFDEQSRGLVAVELFARLFRVKQWTKNLIVFAPLVFAAKLHDPKLCLMAALCTVAFCLASSTVYIINDLCDRKLDRIHVLKRFRPIASGRVAPGPAILLALCTTVLGLCLAFLVRPSLVLVLGSYLTLGMLYSFRLKKVPIVDVMIIAAGFLLRAIAGAVAVAVPASAWFLLCTGLGALFLALEKRRYELRSLGERARIHRHALSGYSVDLIDKFQNIILPSLLCAYTLYSFLSIHGQWMMLTVPFVIYGLMRYVQIANFSDRAGPGDLRLSVPSSPNDEAVTGLSFSFNSGSPEDVLLRDRGIQLAVLGWMLSAAVVVYGKIPSALALLFNSLDAIKN